MSESPVSASLQQAPGARAPGNYQLSDDLARLCLPQEFRDSYRVLAWVNSICILFLLIGLVGLKPPRVIERPLSELQDVVPVVFTPPEEQQKPETEQKPDEPQEPQDTPTDSPTVLTVVAPADANVAFSVPVEGTVAVAKSVAFASPPPAITHAAPQRPSQFNPNAQHEGSFPEPRYPGTALRNRYQGTVLVEIMVDGSGAVSSAKVQKSSGFPTLDDAALDVVKNRWRFPPGKPLWLLWPCTFQLQ
jgi:protein TonB